MLDRLGEVIPANNIQASMVVNFDQAGTKMVHTCNRLRDGSPWNRYDRSRQLTILLGVSLSVCFSPSQVIYAGELQMLVFVRAAGYLTHSSNHWSSKETMLEYIHTFCVP